ncbi:MAG: PEP-CTERM sorting domain-containing protein [Candidatus Moraniibacteriota bacterium]
MRNSLRMFFVLALGMLIGSAQATLITSFEGGSTLASNGLTLAQGIASRATIQSTVTSVPVTLIPTDDTHLFKLMGGMETGIINPALPNDLYTLVTFDDPVVIDKSYLLIDFAFMNRDSSPYNDRQRIGLNGLLYDVTGSAETGWHSPFTLGWQTLAIQFSHPGSVSLALGCVNDTDNAATSYCVWDNFRTADFIPTLAQNNGVPIFSSPNIPNINLTPPVSAVPEPGTWSMVLLGLFLTGLMGKARNQHA